MATYSAVKYGGYKETVRYLDWDLAADADLITCVTGQIWEVFVQHIRLRPASGSDSIKFIPINDPTNILTLYTAATDTTWSYINQLGPIIMIAGDKITFDEGTTTYGIEYNFMVVRYYD